MDKKSLQDIDDKTEKLVLSISEISNLSIANGAFSTFAAQQSSMNQIKEVFESLPVFNSSLDRQSVMKKAMDAGLIRSPLVSSEALKTMIAQQSVSAKLKTVDFSFIANSSTTNSFLDNQSIIKQVMSIGSIRNSQVVSEALKAMNTHQLMSERIKDLSKNSIVGSSIFENTFKSALIQQSAIKIALQIFDSPLILQSITAHNSIFSEAKKTEAIFKSLSSVSSTFLNKPSYISEMAKMVSNIDFDTIDALRDEVVFEEELDNAVTQFTEIENEEGFIEVFSKIPPWIQALFYAFIIQLALVGRDIIANVAANLLTPDVQVYLQENNEKSDEQKVEEISYIPQSLEGFDTDRLRFITGNNVFLRAEPSTNSKVCDELIFAQVVTVLTEEKNWVQIMYQYEDGEAMFGWVFSGYTAKFVK